MKKIVIILILVVFLPLAIYLWPTFLGGDTGFLIVYGTSMLPTIPPGSLVITKTEPTYRIGDIVSFTQTEEGQQKIVVHRIIGINDQGYIIQGDNNPSKDPGFPSEDSINGKVIFATPYFGDLLASLRNPVLLFIISVAMAVIQWEQKRKRIKKEKIRRIRYGLPPTTTNSPENNKTKPRKADYQTFYVALIFNVLTYVLVQASLSYNIRQKGDMATGFLYRIFEPSLASTISFGIYFLFIFGLYFFTKLYQAKITKTNLKSTIKSKTMQMLVKKDFNPVLVLAQFLWVLFVIMSIFHMVTIGTDLFPVITCDPTQELC